MDIIYDLSVLNKTITEACLAHYEAHLGEATDPLALAASIMATPGFPMHYPCHHYLVPAVLLTVCRAAQQKPGVNLQAELDLALERALTVPGGACGFHGCCGAAVGVGIFWSVITDAAPVSGKPWAIANGATGTALLSLAEIGGPRCCKRCSWMSMESTLPKIRELLKLELPVSKPDCAFWEGNHECLRKKCPYYPGETR